MISDIAYAVAALLAVFGVYVLASFSAQIHASQHRRVKHMPRATVGRPTPDHNERSMTGMGGEL